MLATKNTRRRMIVALKEEISGLPLLEVWAPSLDSPAEATRQRAKLTTLLGVAVGIGLTVRERWGREKDDWRTGQTHRVGYLGKEPQYIGKVVRKIDGC